MPSAPSSTSPEPALSDGPSRPSLAQEKHGRFYFDDCMSTFRVEDKLFRVHRFFFIRESEFFETMFSLPLGADSTEGDTPIPLPDVTPSEFEALLRFFYEGMHGLPEDLPFWRDLLSISTRFLFDAVRRRAISELGHCATPVEKIYLAKKYDVPQWLQSSYEELCRRSAPIQLWEAESMGWDTGIQLANAREILRDERQIAPSQPVA
ncbi:hypothetical protein BDY19DRAFT_994244 [Irpex rosettiformis]|uniref:Uncharacterized protein n=1 Tax=Irpex rosettiformis TaxID=378272 RepID=A0ACB8U214_9APHY|nr:hypothetical protein BDY19DRAFT_994244 [Irpex rosettiformis]